MDVSDRRMQVQLTPEAKIASDFYISGRFLRLWALSALWAAQRTPGGFRMPRNCICIPLPVME